MKTSGNSDTSTGGFDFAFKRTPNPWGIEGMASYLQADSAGETTAERWKAGLRGTRALHERWQVFLGGTAEQDLYSGIRHRYVGETGATFTALAGPKNELYLDTGLTYTQEKYTSNEKDDFMGGLLGLKYAYNFSKTSQFLQRLAYFPNFSQSSNWRLESETAVKAALTDHMALKAGVNVRRTNEPPPGFKRTDTTTAVSLVFTF